MIFRIDEWALRRIVGRYDMLLCGKIVQVSSPVMNQSSFSLSMKAG